MMTLPGDYDTGQLIIDGAALTNSNIEMYRGLYSGLPHLPFSGVFVQRQENSSGSWPNVNLILCKMSMVEPCRPLAYAPYLLILVQDDILLT